MRGSHPSGGAIKGPLDGVLRSHGATIVVRDGRCVAAHFGSTTSETAVCLSTVGIADRSDRTTIELCGVPRDIAHAIAALAPLGDRVSCARTGSQSAIVRCDHADGDACRAALVAGVVAVDVTDKFAAVQVIGPRAADLVRTMDFREPDNRPIDLHNGESSYELLVEAKDGPALWSDLLRVGAPLSVACVGLEALEHLAASQRLSRLASHTVP